MGQFLNDMAAKFPGQQVTKWCALRDGGEEALLYYLDKVGPIDHLLEIGTFQGVTTNFLSRFARHITSIDREDFHVICPTHNVDYFIASGKAKAEIISKLIYDFVFIDGDHSFSGVLEDWLLVKDHCNRILFHDYDGPWKDGTLQVIKEHVDLTEWTIDAKNLFCLLERVK